MITAIEIENLRGILSGRLDGLAPLTILTGPNACGKSTVLDALLLATSPALSDALGQAVQRHATVRGGARWLLGMAGDTARLAVEPSSGARWQRELRWREFSGEEWVRDRLLERKAYPPFSEFFFNEKENLSLGSAFTVTAFSVDNQYVGEDDGGTLSDVPFVRLVDLGLAISLERRFTAASQTAQLAYVHELLSALVPQFERLEILVDDDDTPNLYLRSAGRSVPVGLAGDGVQAFVQLVLEVAVAPEGLVLLEEPEVYQHPKTIWQTARVLLADMRRGVQVVLTTHSLELIDALLAEAAGDDLTQMAVFNLMLDEGKLMAGRRAGEEIAFARQTLENDLR